MNAKLHNILAWTLTALVVVLASPLLVGFLAIMLLATVVVAIGIGLAALYYGALHVGRKAWGWALWAGKEVRRWT
jgi:hypothetical protein